MFYPELEQSIHVDVHNEWKAIHPEAAGVTPEEENRKIQKQTELTWL
ncbi:hypothetical protein M7I_1063 [Glarea lozoyensis 74030]|uniref:Uncharacterized protein n=1 Tax=Glarea lozoyensis (strain ATCC 74030 / MF5533) TaxID=1104152 RepID=H0EF25_GLAL7|nr:hypothetical protein M7I_1063 [Glarea lozoyensis 74030]